MNIALINSSRIKPPIAPIGIDYIGEALNAAGYTPEILDLQWEIDIVSSIEHFFKKKSYGLVGISIRNTDDCAFTSRQSFVNDYRNIIEIIRKFTDATIVLGGIGFSAMPDKLMNFLQADAGICGDGEFILPRLLHRLECNDDWQDLPNLIVNKNGKLKKNNLVRYSLNKLPLMRRNWIDNSRYFKEGGQAGFETKRGCTGKCIYCVEPYAKGNRIRTRKPETIVYELHRLLDMNIDYFHTCDSEFNLPIEHAEGVCREIIQSGIGDKIHWYAYCSPVSFSDELAVLMRRAGCIGINFGVDSGDRMMLKRLGREYAPEDILDTVSVCKKAGIVVMLDLLIGSPGESEKSVVSTIELMKRAKPHRVGVSVGVRLYPGTRLSHEITSRKLKRGITGSDYLLDPLFFIDPNVEHVIFELLDRTIEGDKRFFFFDPSNPERNYNYNANQRLIDAINSGHRGAYWDILRKYSSKD